MDFNFHFSSAHGRLNPDDLTFFYYDVAKNSELEELYILSNEELTNIAIESGLVLKPLKQLSFAKGKHSPNKNELYFTYQKKRIKEKKKVELSYQTALFAHLRNSFSHFRISYEAELLVMEDGFGNKRTMKGRVEINKLKQMIYNIIELSNNKLAQANI